MGHVTESIFDGATDTIPMAEVSHVTKSYQYDYRACKPGEARKATHNGYKVIYKHSKWNNESQDFEPNSFLCLNGGRDFLNSWCNYRHELEKDTLAPLEPPK